MQQQAPPGPSLSRQASQDRRASALLTQTHGAVARGQMVCVDAPLLDPAVSSKMTHTQARTHFVFSLRFNFQKLRRCSYSMCEAEPHLRPRLPPHQRLLAERRLIMQQASS